MVPPAGPNWPAIGIIIGAVTTVLGVVSRWLNGRFSRQDAKIDEHGKVINDTRVSVARIEGYMARQNGNQGRTPDLLPDLPGPVVVPPASELVVEEKAS